MALFKIRRKKDCLYSVGGLYPTWAEHGVRWASLHQVRVHIDEALARSPEVYLGCEVVEIAECVLRVVSPNEMLKIPRDVLSSETKKFEGGRRPVRGKDRKNGRVR